MEKSELIVLILQTFFFFGVLPIFLPYMAMKMESRSKQRLFVFLASVSFLIGGVLLGNKLHWDVISSICSSFPLAIMFLIAFWFYIPWLVKMKEKNKNQDVFLKQPDY